MKWYQKTWVVVLLTIFVWPVGLILMWSQKKFNIVARIIVTLLILIIAIAGCGGNKNGTTSTNTKATNEINKTNEDKKQEEEKTKIQELENKYVSILESGKSYSDMTNEEGNLANEMISNWDKLSEEFKTKYNDSKNTISASINDYNAKKKAEEDAKKAAEEAASYDTGITYDQLARTPDDYKGNKVKFSGKVIQVMEGDKETDLRIAVDGNYETVIFVGYDPSITSTRVLENDYVTIKGKSIGIYSYQSALGGKISIPGVYVDNIQIN